MGKKSQFTVRKVAMWGDREKMIKYGLWHSQRINKIISVKRGKSMIQHADVAFIWSIKEVMTFIEYFEVFDLTLWNDQWKSLSKTGLWDAWQPARTNVSMVIVKIYSILKAWVFWVKPTAFQLNLRLIPQKGKYLWYHKPKQKSVT